MIQTFKTFADAYFNMLHSVYYSPQYETAPRDMKIKENLNAIFTIENPKSNLYLNKVRSSPVEYICRELVWYLSGDPNPTYIAKHASLWDRIRNPDGTVNSNYGNLALHATTPSQYEWAYGSLAADKDSRQAIMNYNGIAGCHFDGVKDFTCTLSSVFHIRDNKLHSTTIMRSNDIIFGLPADFVWFTIVHQQMYKHLQKVYPELEMGSYTHIAHSLHLYEKHFDLAKDMLQSEFVAASLPFLNKPLWDETGALSEKSQELTSKVIMSDEVELDTKDELINFICERAQGKTSE